MNPIVHSGDPKAEQVLDSEIIQSIRDFQNVDAPDFMTELIDLFLDDSQTLMMKIRKSLLDGHNVVAQRALHTLKGTSGNLGARIFANECAHLELFLIQGDLVGAVEFLPELDEAYERVRIAMKGERRPKE